ncbi:MarR family winged helix-turn-helix transcriptional regulator [Vulgatibacter sp.]|uniref:MarR family winged helix-turn-helix transcriptional regulator n=1 Tax=Vulgatibacter sp. TaxID=1971226 RepID=UPI00356392F2
MKLQAPESAVAQDVLDELLGYALRRAQLAVYDDFADALGSVTPQRFAALVIVGANPGLSQTALGETLQIARSGSMLLVDWLEEEGLVERRARPGDRRANCLHLTAAGEEALRSWRDRALEHDRRISCHMSDEERAQLHALLRKLAAR